MVGLELASKSVCDYTDASQPWTDLRNNAIVILNI